MINLIKNELIKLAHKPGLYILLALSLSFILLGAFMSNMVDQQMSSFDRDYIEVLESELDIYDLTKPSELSYYVNDKTTIETYQLIIDNNFGYTSPEYYYVENEVNLIIAKMNEAKYIDKDEEVYNISKAEYDKAIEGLKNFDWKKVINRQINDNKEMILSLERLKETEEDSTETNKQIAYLKEENKVLDYRIKNNIPFAWNDASFALTYYLDTYNSYIALNPNKDEYCKEDKAIISEYKTQKYKLENNLIKNDEDMDSTAASFMYIFVAVDVYLLIALLMIVGGIVSDEFNKGTIKQLLLRPFTRTQILTSKIIASIIAFFIFTLAYSLLTIVISSIVTGGFASFAEPMIVYDFTKELVVEYNVLTYSLISFIAILPVYITIMFIVLLLSIITTNSVASILSGFAIFTFSEFLSEFEQVKWVVLLPMTHWDFTSYLFGGSHWFKYTSFGLSFIIIVVTLIALIAANYLSFKHKDIKNQ